MYFEPGGGELDLMEGHMAPYWEPWAVLNELPRRLKNWLARPELGCDTALASDIAADLGSETASERSLVEDDSDLLKRRMKALHLDPGELDHPNAQLVGIKPAYVRIAPRAGNA